MTWDGALQDYQDSLENAKPDPAFLGAFIDGAFRTIVDTDPSLTWVRYPDGTPTTVKHGNKMNLNTGREDIPIGLGPDAYGALSIVDFDPAQAGAVIQANPGIEVPSHSLSSHTPAVAALDVGSQEINNVGAVTIGGATPDPLSMLDITSVAKGILVPRMTATQRDAIVTPPTGLLVYVTTSNDFYFFNGATWELIGSSGGGGGTVVFFDAEPGETLNVPTATADYFTDLAAGTPIQNVGTAWSSGAPERLTAPVDGVYDVDIRWSVDHNQTWAWHVGVEVYDDVDALQREIAIQDWQGAGTGYEFYRMYASGKIYLPADWYLLVKTENSDANTRPVQLEAISLVLEHEVTI